jgi:hypothetical protein
MPVLVNPPEKPRQLGQIGEVLPGSIDPGGAGKPTESRVT